MKYVFVGFVLMISIWGIVNMIAGGLFGTSDDSIKIPDVPSTFIGSDTNYL